MLPLPPTEEQRAIVEHLDDKLDTIDSTLKKIGAAIDHLREYRTALITAAVTGKIDVCEEAA